MLKWEYYRHKTPDFSSQQLDWYGDQGWELMCVKDDWWYFKRPKITPVTSEEETKCNQKIMRQFLEA